MKVETIKDTIFKKGIKAIPNFMWVLCASYALVMGTNVIVLKFSDIDADKHINRYLDIVISRQENKPNRTLELKLELLQEEFNQYKQQTDNRLLTVETLAHESGVK